MEPFVPQALTPEQVEQLYTATLAEVEMQVLQSWQAHVLEPEDPAVRARYAQRRERLDALRADYERLKSEIGQSGNA